LTRLSDSGEAAYAVLAAQLRQAILSGTYRDGEQLPTEAELAFTHGVSRQTVRRAMQDLVAEGMIFRVRGRGTFPAPRSGRYIRQFGSVEDLMALSLDTQLQLVVPLQRKIVPEAAGRLRLPSDSVVMVRFLRMHDGAPLCVSTVYLPPEIGRLIEDVPDLVDVNIASTITVLGLIDQRASRPIVESDQSITVATDPAAATSLGCAPDQSLLRIDRIYYDADEQPVELAISWFHPDRYSYRVRLRRGHG
jgi:GntR family transcriptional regulator